MDTTPKATSHKIALVDGMVLLQQMTKKPTTVVAVKDQSECLNERLMVLTQDCLVFDLLVSSMCLTLTEIIL